MFESNGALILYQAIIDKVIQYHMYLMRAMLVFVCHGTSVAKTRRKLRAYNWP